MCGRYTLRSHKNFYGVPTSQVLLVSSPRYNIAPSQDIPVIIQGDNDRCEMVMLRWGLVPSWSKDAGKDGGGLINARAETLEQKPSFAESFLRRRCLIAADGFYEWKREGKWRQPYFFQMHDESLFAFAGIWDEWESADQSIISCAIITTAANELVGTIHDRMPVILTDETYLAWLRDDADPRELKALLTPFPAAAMKSFPVSEKVNSGLVDEPHLVEPVPEMTSGWLF